MKKRGFWMGKRNGAGGKVQAGESIIEAALRELEEETTINLTEQELSVRGVFHFHFAQEPHQDMDVHLFTWQYDGDFAETEEMKPQWRDVDQIPYDQMRDDDKYRLPRIIADKECSIEYSFLFNEEGIVIDNKVVQ
jgi:8-oxo-dGTP pyrophosphatase MutT (NUDIX family)